MYVNYYAILLNIQAKCPVSAPQNKKLVVTHHLAFVLFGWGTRIRTLISGVRVRCPAVRRFPNRISGELRGTSGEVFFHLAAVFFLVVSYQTPDHSGYFSGFFNLYKSADNRQARFQTSRFSSDSINPLPRFDFQPRNSSLVTWPCPRGLFSSGRCLFPRSIVSDPRSFWIFPWLRPQIF